MWRFISSTRCYLTTHSWKTLRNKLPSSSSLPHVLYKTLYPSNSTNPIKFPHQNHIFMCYSSFTESETEPHHPTSSAEGLDLNDATDSDSDSSDEDNDTNSRWVGRKVTVGSGKITEVFSLLLSDVDESFEDKLDGMDLNFDEEFLMKVLKYNLVRGEILIRFFKWGMGKDEFVVTATSLDEFTRAICQNPKRKNMCALWGLVKEIGQKEKKGIVNTSVLNHMLSALAKIGKGKIAFEVFEKFEELGCVRNIDTYFLTIVALCKRALYDWASLVCQKMLDAGMLPPTNRICDIIMLLCEGRKEKQAHVVYLYAKSVGNYPAQMAVNLLISCLSKEDDTVHIAREMLADLCDDDRKYGIDLFSCVIHGLCRKKDAEGAKKLLLEMIEKGPIPTNAVFNTVIDSLSEGGDLDDAEEMLRLMESRG